MTNILTADEAARVVMVDSTDEKLADILPQVDSYIQQATGRDWTQDSPINPVAKRAARLQLALTYDLGAMQPSQINTLRSGLICALTQLETITAGIDALQSINSAAYVEDMETYLVSDALGLNLIDYNRLLPAGKYSAAKAVLDGRPSGGYVDINAIQMVLDAAIKIIM